MLCVLILSTFLVGIHADNFLVLGDWGGSPFYPYSTLIERTTAHQMSITAVQNKTSFVVALGKIFVLNSL